MLTFLYLVFYSVLKSPHLISRSLELPSGNRGSNPGFRFGSFCTKHLFYNHYFKPVVLPCTVLGGVSSAAPQVIRKIRPETFSDASGHLKLWCQFFNVLSESKIKWYRNEEEIVQVKRK